MKNYPQKVLAAGRVTIPRDLMRKFNLKEGDLVIVYQNRKGMEIIPAKVIPITRK